MLTSLMSLTITSPRLSPPIPGRSLTPTMGDPNSIVGLSLRLARAYGLRPRHALAPIALVALATAALALRPHPPPAAAPNTSADADRVWFAEPTLVATDEGWLLGYSRSERRAQRQVAVVALRRDGTLASTPLVLSTDTLAGRPTLARVGDRYALAWISLPDDGLRSTVASFAVVDGHGTLRVPTRRLDSFGTRVFSLSAASNGRHFAFAAPTFDDGRPIALAVHAPDGTPVADLRLPHEAQALSLGSVGNDWLLPFARHDARRNRSRLSVLRLSPDGALLNTLELGGFEGEVHHLRARTRGRATALVWGQDGTWWQRHEPYFARLDEGRVEVSPMSLGARQTSSDRDVVCDDLACIFTWVEVGPGPHDQPEWMLERRTLAGHPLGSPLRLPSRGGASFYEGPSVAGRNDGRGMLAVLPVSGRDGPSPGALLVQRLDAEGRPQGAPRPLPLP